ncbi:MAG: hypothetical protein PSV16_06625 [Flavobacterium sp.]|nr:hypothetical protein [Flavobacterium sp.]
MKKNELVRDYRFTDAVLYIKSKALIGNIQRDQAAFQDFGITSEVLEAFSNSINTFSDMPSDEEGLGSQMTATQQKDAAGEMLKLSIKNVMGRVQLKFGIRSARYKHFGTTKLSTQTDAELLITAKRVVIAGHYFMNELVPYGLTEALLAQLTDLSTEFENLIVQQRMKVGEREIMTEDRILIGNALYKTLSDFANIGTTIWASVSEAKYNDYLIYS